LTRVNLFHSRLILETLPVTFDVLRCAWCLMLLLVLIRFNAVLCSLLGTHSDNLSCSFDIWDTIKLAR
jgi:hypothetical protein